MNPAVMRDPRFVFALLFAVFVIRPCCAAAIEISDSWVRATIGQSGVTAGYASIINSGGENDRLLSVATDAAAKTEVHGTTMGDGGVMRMRPVDALDVPAGETVRLAEGGDHLMLMGVATPLKDGQEIQVTLTFEKAGSLTAPFRVARRNPFP